MKGALIGTADMSGGISAENNFLCHFQDTKVILYIQQLKI